MGRTGASVAVLYWRPGQGRQGGAPRDRQRSGLRVRGGRPPPYVGVARRTSNGGTGGRTRAADHDTWRDNFDAPQCGCGLGRRGALGRRGLGMARPWEAALGLGRRGMARCWRTGGTARRTGDVAARALAFWHQSILVTPV
jgi:hypothetical protein